MKVPDKVIVKKKINRICLNWKDEVKLFLSIDAIIFGEENMKHSMFLPGDQGRWSLMGYPSVNYAQGQTQLKQLSLGSSYHLMYSKF